MPWLPERCRHPLLYPPPFRFHHLKLGTFNVKVVVVGLREGSIAGFGSNTPLGRAGQPVEIAGCYVFLASDEASYMNEQVLHPNGGEIINT